MDFRNKFQIFLISENSSNDKGSVVRLFTNASLSLFTLSEKEGYKYCDMCERWVYNENRHCFKCEACTSKVLEMTCLNAKINYFTTNS